MGYHEEFQLCTLGVRHLLDRQYDGGAKGTSISIGSSVQCKKDQTLRQTLDNKGPVEVLPATIHQGRRSLNNPGTIGGTVLYRTGMFYP